MQFSITNNNKNYLAVAICNALILSKTKPVFLCVGSDKVVGDSLGVITGELLKNKYKINAHIYGTFDCAVTAQNLHQVVKNIKDKHVGSPIILIDGILGNMEDVGEVKFVKSGSIAGGEFNNGILVGDYSILAVISAKSIDALQFLNAVKLKNIVALSEFIAQSIARAYKISQNLIS